MPFKFIYTKIFLEHRTPHSDSYAINVQASNKLWGGTPERHEPEWGARTHQMIFGINDRGLCAFQESSDRDLKRNRKPPIYLSKIIWQAFMRAHERKPFASFREKMSPAARQRLHGCLL